MNFNAVEDNRDLIWRVQQILAPNCEDFVSPGEFLHFSSSEKLSDFQREQLRQLARELGKAFDVHQFGGILFFAPPGLIVLDQSVQPDTEDS